MVALDAGRRSPTRAGRVRPHGRGVGGKDSVTGHWEMMGIVLDGRFRRFRPAFPSRSSTSSSAASAGGTLGNVVASGTEIIERLGAEHVRTGKPIVYTSADSVFQIAAHEDVIPIAELYRICEVAFEIVGRGLGVGRVIARPFVGPPGRVHAAPPTGTTTRSSRRARRCSTC